MAQEPHPFIEDESPHKGWHVYRFELLGSEWRLTTIDNGREPAYSLLSHSIRSTDVVWPEYRIVQLDGIVSVEVCVSFIRIVYGAFEVGKREGCIETQFKMRQALGL